MLHKPCRTRERAFFQFPDDEQQRKTFLRFLNCSDAQEFKHVLVCAMHFSEHVINKNEKRFLLIKKFKHVPLIASPSKCFWWGSWDNQSTVKISTKARIFKEDQLEEFKKSNTITSLDYINEKQMKSLGEGSFLEKNFNRSYHAAFPYWRTFFFVDWSPHVEIYYKGIMMLPLNYWWKGLSAWWSCFFKDRWFDKEQALCIALHSSAKSERGLTGRRNSVEHGNFSGI